MKGMVLTLVGGLQKKILINIYIPCFSTRPSDEYLHYGSDHAYYLYNVAAKKYLSVHDVNGTASVTLQVSDLLKVLCS